MFHKRDVLFLCTFVPLVLRDDIEEVVETYGLRGRLVEPKRLHISLFNFGQPSQAIVDRIRRAMASIRSSALSFRVILDQLVIGARQSLLLPSERIEGLERYSEQCLNAFAEQDLHFSKGTSAKPHVTLGYGDVDRGTKALDPISWLVQEVSLIVSHRGEHRYDFLDRFPLGAGFDGRSCQ